MGWYAVQSADWSWDSPDGPGLFVEADSAQEAIRLAIQIWGPEEGGDAGQMKVAKLVWQGTAGFEWKEDSNVPIVEPIVGDINEPPGQYLGEFMGDFSRMVSYISQLDTKQMQCPECREFLSADEASITPLKNRPPDDPFHCPNCDSQLKRIVSFYGQQTWALA